MPTQTPLHVGQHLRFLGTHWSDTDHRRLNPGDIVVITELDSYLPSIFTAELPGGGRPGGYPPNWWFSCRFFEPCDPPTEAEMAKRARELAVKRREIECPKVNLP